MNRHTSVATAATFLRVAVLATSAAWSLGCSGSPESVPPETAEVAAAGTEPMVVSSRTESDMIAASGVVREAIDGGGYTYARVTTDAGEIWTAGPQTTLVVGDVISLVDAVPMEEFPSKSLGRTFEVLHFLGRYETLTTDTPIGTGNMVLTVVDVAGYTYLQVDVNGAPMWVAAPSASVSEGDRVSWSGGTVMYEFTSQTLDQTFDEILFVGAVAVVN